MTPLITVSDPLIFEMIGVAGFGLYVLNYTLLTFHRLHSGDAAYFAINLIAAGCVLTGLLVSFNLASAMIQAFWILISTAAIAVRIRTPRADRATVPQPAPVAAPPRAA